MTDKVGLIEYFLKTFREYLDFNPDYILDYLSFVGPNRVEFFYDNEKIYDRKIIKISVTENNGTIEMCITFYYTAYENEAILAYKRDADDFGKGANFELNYFPVLILSSCIYEDSPEDVMSEINNLKQVFDEKIDMVDCNIGL